MTLLPSVGLIAEVAGGEGHAEIGTDAALDQAIETAAPFPVTPTWSPTTTEAPADPHPEPAVARH